MLRSIAFPVATALLVLTLGACAPGARELVFTATDNAFSGPDSATAGWTTVTLANNGQGGHHLQLVLLEDGKTTQDLVDALAADGETFPSWARPFGGPNPGDPGATSSAVVDLFPGTYAILDVIPDAEGVPHFLSGMFTTLTVTAADASAPEPTADITVDLADFNFTISGDLTAGDHIIQINNGGNQVHEMFLVHLQQGKTADDYLNSPPDAPPPGSSKGGITGIEPSSHQYVPVTLETGRYAMFCFFPDPATHAPHFVLGMVYQFDVP